MSFARRTSARSKNGGTCSRSAGHGRLPQATGAGCQSSWDSSARTKKNIPQAVRRFLQIVGPGFITGASDDDPSGIVTYAIAGASTGYSTLWTALLTFPLMAGT